MKKIIFLAAILQLLAVSLSHAQSLSFGETFEPYTLSNTQQRTIQSEVNGISYTLYISYPPEYYSSPEKQYPVVYLLDADYSFAIAKNVTDHLSERNHLQEVIIVGIAYTDKTQYRMNRTRDYTPTKTPDGGYSEEIQRVSGGAPAFLEFMEKELFPYMANNFRINSKRIITGHSFGGLFATWVSLIKPELFDGYIIVSPSLWYDDHYLFDLEETTAKSRNDQELYFFFTVGNLEVNSLRNMPRDLENFVNKLKDRHHKYMHIEFELAEDETHNSVFPFGFTKGIRFVLNGR